MITQAPKHKINHMLGLLLKHNQYLCKHSVNLRNNNIGENVKCFYHLKDLSQFDQFKTGNAQCAHPRLDS